MRQMDTAAAFFKKPWNLLGMYWSVGIRWLFICLNQRFKSLLYYLFITLFNLNISDKMKWNKYKTMSLFSEFKSAWKKEVKLE